MLVVGGVDGLCIFFLGVGAAAGGFGALGDLDLEFCFNAAGASERGETGEGCEAEVHVEGVDGGVGENGAGCTCDCGAPGGEDFFGLRAHGGCWAVESGTGAGKVMVVDVTLRMLLRDRLDSRRCVCLGFGWTGVVTYLWRVGAREVYMYPSLLPTPESTAAAAVVAFAGYGFFFVLAEKLEREVC